MRVRTLVVGTAALLCASVAGAQATHVDVTKYDANSDKRLDELELAALARDLDATMTLKQVANFVSDVINFQCRSVCKDVSFAEADFYLADRQRRQREAARAKRSILWKGFAVTREVVDNPNPRGTKPKGPAVLSLKWDQEAKAPAPKRQENAFGALQLWTGGFTWPLRRVSFTPGVDFDVDGSKPKNETTVSFGLPISLLKSWGSDKPVESITVGVTPKFISDWQLERDVREVAINLSVASRPLGLGLMRPAQIRTNGALPTSRYLMPTVQLELGEIRKANGNAKLIEGTKYKRIAARTKATLFLNGISEKLRLDVDATRRFDMKEKWARWYVENRLSCDLTFNGAAELSLVQRRGKKPPTFLELNEWLLGIGIKL